MRLEGAGLEGKDSSVKVDPSISLPRSFSSHPKARGIRIVLERDLRLTPRGRLRFKLLVFDRMVDLRAFWKRVLGQGVGPSTYGIVSPLRYTVTSFKNGEERSRVVVDERYVCVVGLLRRWLGTRTVAHEAVHVGFAYAKRVGRPPRIDGLVVESGQMDEELVAYPAGDACGAMAGALHEAGLW